MPSTLMRAWHVERDPRSPARGPGMRSALMRARGGPPGGADAGASGPRMVLQCIGGPLLRAHTTAGWAQAGCAALAILAPALCLGAGLGLGVAFDAVTSDSLDARIHADN